MHLQNGNRDSFTMALIDECCEGFQMDSTKMTIHNYDALDDTDFSLEDWELFLSDLKLKLVKEKDVLVLKTKSVMQFRFAFTFLRMMLRERDKQRVLDYFKSRDTVSFDKAIAFMSRTRESYGIPLLGISANDYAEDPYERLLSGEFKSMRSLIPKFTTNNFKWAKKSIASQLTNAKTIEEFLKVDTRSCRL